MATQYELDHMYMKMALAMTTISNGVRAKVGAVAVTKNGVVLTGVNGLPKQLGNQLEYIENVSGAPYLVTKPEVIHAEENVILKAAREGISLIDSTFYITLSTCVHCGSQLISLGTSRVVYLNEYRTTTGIDILKQSGIIVDKLTFEMVGYEF